MKYNKNGGDNISVAKATRDLLEAKPFLKELMEMDAVNYRGLARYFKPKVLEKTGKEEINLDSIVMAIRRYEQDTTLGTELSERINHVLANSEITLKSDIMYYTFERKPSVQDDIQGIYDEIREISGDRFYALQSDAEVGVVVDRRNSDILDEMAGKHNVKDSHTDLAMVIIDSPEEVLEADGIISYITEKIIFNGIGLMDIFTTYTEFVLLVKEKDSTRLYQTLLDVKEKSRKQIN